MGAAPLPLYGRQNLLAIRELTGTVRQSRLYLLSQSPAATPQKSERGPSLGASAMLPVSVAVPRQSAYTAFISTCSKCCTPFKVEKAIKTVKHPHSQLWGREMQLFA